MAKLNHVLRSAMGWDRSRAHSFRSGSGDYYDETDAALADVLSPGDELIYTYDRGWRHRVMVEQTVVAQPGRDYPYCVDGAGNCPYEDIGGPAEWTTLMAAPADHADRLASLGLEHLVEFDPEAFDLGNRNMVLRAGSWYSR